MRTKVLSVGMTFAIMILMGCQKVINLDLKDDAGKYVIEGNITNLAGPYTVTISLTGKVSNDYVFNGVDHATVVVGDNTGNSETLQEKTQGVYQTATLTGVEGRKYYLSVTLGDKHFTATSVMPHQVPFDSLYIEQEDNWGKIVKTVVPVFTDPFGKGNSYKFNQTINGNLDKTLYYENDDFTDGKESTWSLLRPDPDSTLHLNDQVKVEMQCIDSAAYKYWYSMDQSSTGNGNGLPSNPVTNIQGGALGYFSAHTSQTRSIIVK
ncbi:MAG TPA: DUF4249 domain-containing protein [Puia sp.]|nr:DUF4249 domain-containing protein [Puia sp.]